MKFCSKCGNELFDEAVLCPKCGCKVEKEKNTILKIVDKIKVKHCMILGSISTLATVITFIIKYIQNNKAYQITKNDYPDLLHLIHHPFYYGIVNVIKSPFFYIAIICFIFGFILRNKRRNDR